MKRTITVFLAFLLCLCCFAACGKTQKNEISMYDMSRAMLGAAVFSEMSYVSSADDNAQDLFGYLSDFDYSKVDSFFLAYATNGKGNADEVAVVRLKDTSDVQNAVSSLQKHLEKRVSLYKTYDPTQSEKVSKGQIFSKGDFAVLIVSDDNTAVKDAFNAFLAN